MPLNPKQLEYFNHAPRRWNVKTGAVRSGKTYSDFFVIPKRIRACSSGGQIVLIGNTTATLARNILDPMREIWGAELVGEPSSSGDSVRLFGRRCAIIGAASASRAAKLQGASVAYAYGDEITTWSEEVFRMLQSRLDRPDSVFDGTCNPSHPGHWFKKFLDSGADIYLQTYTIDDNGSLAPSFVRELKKEYAGTVFYDRYILGKWSAAEGCVYKQFAAHRDEFYPLPVDKNSLTKITLGVDFGGTKSGTAFCAVGISGSYEYAAVLESVLIRGTPDAYRLSEEFCNFCEHVISKWGVPSCAYCDSAESVLIRSLRGELLRRRIPVAVHNAQKSSINDRIRLTLRLMAQGRLRLSFGCASLADAFSEAVWDPSVTFDRRLDNGTSDIDSLDAFEYCIERDALRLMR